MHQHKIGQEVHQNAVSLIFILKETFLPLRIVFPPFGCFYTVPTCGSLHLHFQFNVTYDETVLAEERYQNGTKAIISCPENNNNNKTMICQSNGTWLGGDVPKCCKLFFFILLNFATCQ